MKNNNLLPATISTVSFSLVQFYFKGLRNELSTPVVPVVLPNTIFCIDELFFRHNEEGIAE